MVMTVLEEGLPYTIRAVDCFAASLFSCLQPIWLMLLGLLFGLMHRLPRASMAARAYTVCDKKESR